MGRKRKTWGRCSPRSCTKLEVCFILLLLSWSTSLLVAEQKIGDEELYQAHCREALGMHSRLIPDSSISASSAYDGPSVGPQNSRIRTEQSGGAWCPKEQIKHDIYEYLEIDLGTIKVVTLVETQGRFGNGQGQEYAEYFMLEYQRFDHGPWRRYLNKKGQEMFRGNRNTYIAELREVNPPIIGRRIRFIPYSRHPRTICMRVELYGCSNKNGVISYSMPEGHKRGNELKFYDLTYDGQKKNDYLSEGLGQLTDTETGITNFRLDKSGTGKKGYEWVGWKNETVNSPPVEIIFEFDTVRNFSSAKIHANNLFSKGVHVFRQAKLYFSIGGEYYNSPPEEFNYLKDTLMEFYRPVIIPIPHKIGRFIKMELYYESRWILISEVKFESEIVKSNVSHELPPSATQQNILPPVTDVPEVKPESDPKQTNQNPEVPVVVEVKSGSEEKGRPLKPGDKGRMDEKLEVGRGSGDGRSGGGVKGTTSRDLVPPEHQEDMGLQEEHIGIIIGALAALILLLFAIAVFIVLRQQRKKAEEDAAYGPYDKHSMGTNLDEYKMTAGTNAMLASYHMYNAIAMNDGDDDDTLKKLKMKDTYSEPSEKGSRSKLPKTPDSTDQSESNVPASPLYVKLPPEPVFQSPTEGCEPTSMPPTPPPKHAQPSPPTVPPPPIPPPPHPAALLRMVDFIPIKQDPNGNGNGNGTSSFCKTPPPAPQGGTGSTAAGATSGEFCIKSLVEFPRDNLKFLEKLGEGQFGEIHLCEAYLGKDRRRSKSIRVAIKTLNRTQDIVTRDHFMREAQILSELKDPNVAQVIGVCTETEPIFMILEYTKYGDLHQFLRQCVPETETNVPHARPISYGCQIFMATQMASGMKYLESLNMVHRDLAARNCLVTQNYTVKITDFGMSRHLYDSDYYRIEGRATLPIRWMAWESVMLGKFSSKSDVWAFAVTLWETLTLARERPFDTMSDEGIIDNCSHFFKGDSQEVYLAQPPSCPKEIYDLMWECWNREASLRPSFREIHMFLQRKNMGYDPKNDEVMTHYEFEESPMV